MPATAMHREYHVKSTAPAGAAAPATSSPTKKKIQMKKTRLPEVGPTIRDIENNVIHYTGKQLGQGGFARVYQVKDSTGKSLAFKAIMKEALLHQRKNRQKVLAEILIHRSLSHPNIVNFIDLFQDEANIYFKLELCSNGSMNDMVRTRGPCLDEEARFYMVQILSGTKFMHVNHVIHRDLKLGNIFLDANMNIKIGDFGLAALLKDPEERKKTMCGTPNYIAPEILYEGAGNGHSFEVDTWAVGVILYTLLAGKPPFQTSSVPAIYEKIRRNEYTIPDHVRPEARDLIKRILNPDPSQRPSLMEIMRHPWFTAGLVPLHIPATATKAVPQLVLPRTKEESLRNLETLKLLSGWRDDADDEVEEEEMTDEQRRQSAKEKRRAQEKAEEERERMDKEFEGAIQPGSSLAGFLQLGRKALVKAPDLSGPVRPLSVNSGLSRQISALSLSRQQTNGQAMANGEVLVKGSGETFEALPPGAFISSDKENAGHSAPGSRMMPPPAMNGSNGPASARSYRYADPTASLNTEERRLLGHKARLVAAMTASGSSSSLASTASHGLGGRPDSRQSVPDHLTGNGEEANSMEISNLESMIQNLTDSLDAFQNKSRFVPKSGNASSARANVRSTSAYARIRFDAYTDSLNAERLLPCAPRSYIICWLDEMDKYGLGYALSDGSAGVYLKDDSSVTSNGQRTHMEHVTNLHGMRASVLSSSANNTPRCESYQLPPTAEGSMSREVLRKYKILAHFQRKIDDRTEGLELPLFDSVRTAGMTFVWRWYRCLQAIVFRFSNSMVQFNFYDHTKLFFSHDGLVISAIIPDRTTGEQQPMRTWLLEEFVDIAEKSRSAREQQNQNLPVFLRSGERFVASDEEASGTSAPLAYTTSEERKQIRLLLGKVKYARDTMIKIAAKDVAATASSGIPTSQTSSAASSVASLPGTATSTTTPLSRPAATAARTRSTSSTSSTLARSNSVQSLNSNPNTVALRRNV